ncbi:hypothetical protein GALL_343550 [mine drainage metagenome]|uniref:TPM domain-containing protein n=1 Tax=mine drainage metagenome TaxID=410659 RepID=A0A1J5QVI1_9ZZZZ
MGKLKRFLKHLAAGRWQVTRYFPSSTMRAIEKAIHDSEHLHGGELRFVVEAGLEWQELLRRVSPRARAVEVFSQLRVWDTEHNSGVLIYLLLADRDVEIVADRGIHARVGEAAWKKICHEMETRFRQGEFEPGVIEGVAAITVLLKQHFPTRGADNPNEISDAAVILPLP